MREMTDLYLASGPPSVDDMLGIVLAYYSIDGNGAGGNLHIVLDDGNIEANHVEWCKERCHEEGDLFGWRLATLLLQMSEDARQELWERS